MSATPDQVGSQDSAFQASNGRPRRGTGRGTRRRALHPSVGPLVLVALLAATVLPVLPAMVAHAASVVSASFTGGSGTASVGGVLYAKQGAVLTLDVITDATTTCVEVLDSGGSTVLGKQTSGSGNTTWKFTTTTNPSMAVLTAGAGNGLVTVQTNAWKNVNNAGKCTNENGTQSASYTLDNTGPTLTGAVSPVPNAAGWNRADLTVNWSATDASSGVASGPTPVTSPQTADTTGATKTATATDRVGNTGTGSVTVKLDKTPPTITATRSPAANANGWNNSPVTVTFACSDATSGITGACPGAAQLDTDGASQSATGTANDTAGNSANASVTGVNIDRVAPTLSGAPTTAANAVGWYRGDVSIAWTCNDNLSGFVAGGCPAASTITGEGLSLTAPASVADKAGNTASATSAAVNIDRHAPMTTASAPPQWNNSDVTVSLEASDGLSGVTATYYALDGGAQQAYNAVTGIGISSEGVHTVSFWSVDKAGNTETAKSAQVKIDKSSPTITHTQSPAANPSGWNNGDVTVHFICNDTVSGIESCTPDKTFTTEGANQTVTGTARDNAGNTATDPSVSVSIDKAAPTITASRTPAANANGWNNSDVTVSFGCTDNLSGIASCPDAVTLGHGASQSASGTAVDNAGNPATAGVSGVNVDKSDPTISGVVVGSPNEDGWFNGDVTVRWTCSDALSGLPGATTAKPCPLADTVVTGEGSDLSATASVTDRAGNTASFTVSGIKIDRTRPSTSTTAPAGWSADDVTLTLGRTDNLSGVKSTLYSVDGGPEQAGTSVTIADNGMHSVTFHSIDYAGNAETPHTVTVKVDKAAPTIDHVLSPLANANGWNNTDVDVIFGCTDQPTLSGLKSCTAQQKVASEGKEQPVAGSATDNAGNTASATATVSIDRTLPTITGAPDRAPNGSGWYKADVTVRFTCTDPVPAPGVVPSGVDSCTPAKTLGEGADQSADGTVLDLAGNSTATTVSGINIDKTDPTLSGAATTSPNGAGWYKGDVTITWSCDDALSGIADGACPADSTVRGEGQNLTAPASLADRAGNVVTGSSAPVNIDRTAPETSISAPSGWVNDSATVTLTAHDALSGVAATAYKLDGGAEQDYDAATGIVIASEGDHTLEYNSVDKAGNAEAPRTVHVKIDRTAPTIGHKLDPAANSNGWNNSASVTVTFTCDDPLSGIRSCTGPQTVTAEGKGQAVAGSAVDNAGNTQSDTAKVSIDRTLPTVSGRTDRGANAAGWYDDDVTVNFTCDDPAPPGVEPSGIAACTGPQTLAEGRGQSVEGAATDAAGNGAAATVSGINVDKTAPTLTGAASAANGAGWYNTDASVSWTCSDALSGIPDNACPAPSTVTGEGNNLAATATVTDAAGNPTTTTVEGLKIDRSAPLTAADAPGGWSNSAVTVNLTPTDGLSGVQSTWFSLDTGAAQSGTSVPVSTEGNHSLKFWSVDVAGNIEAAQVVAVKVDFTPPAIGHAHVPAANANMWNNSDVTVTFNCSDALSGVASCTGSRTISTEGRDQPVNGTAVDNAGNTAADHDTVNLDKTKPTIAAAADRQPNGSGWYDADVTVSFECGDNLSGVETCTGPAVLAEGRNQSASGTAVDAAGNTAGDSVSGINVDKTPPGLVGTATSLPNGAGWYRAPVTINWSCTDALSGVPAGACPGNSIIDGEGTGLTAGASVADRAGNGTAATSAPINVDQTAPKTTATAPTTWVNASVTVALSATDNRSGVKATEYQLDGGPVKTGTSVSIATEGTHTLEYWSTDVADNFEAHNTIQVLIDQSNPTINHTQTPSANGAGWNRTGVTVTFTCDDQAGLSGIATCTAPQTVTTEGLNQPVTGVAVDNAGNRAEDPATVSIDTTKPTISGSTDRSPNAAGWYDADVATSFHCADSPSGIASCTPKTTLGEGAGQSVIGTAVDAAGNSASATVGPISVDKTAPTLTGTPSGGNAAGWHNGNATVTWSCGDNLSGVPAGACPTASTVDGEGDNLSATQSVSDTAGNQTTRTVSGIRIDRTAPGTTSDAPTGWVNSAVTVKLTASDPLSGVRGTFYALDGGVPQPYAATGIVVPGEGVHTLTFWSVDKADNAEAAKTVTLRIDTSPPSISGTATTAPNANGWYKAPVTVHFTCSDPALVDGNPGSGVATCQPDVEVGSDGTNQGATGTAVDSAGNKATTSVTGLRIDQKPPAIESVNVENKTYTLGAVPAANCSATDNLSGLDANDCTVTVTGGKANANGTGTFDWTASATDNAGHNTSRSGTYHVVYGHGTTFFLQPINDTAHQTGLATSVFKAGSTVPVKFQLKRVDGTIVQAGSAPTWQAPVDRGPTTAAVNESTFSATTDSGSTFRWDATAQQYIYNWKTPNQAGRYWQIGVKLDDGMTYFVNIGLK